MYICVGVGWVGVFENYEEVGRSKQQKEGTEKIVFLSDILATTYVMERVKKRRGWYSDWGRSKVELYGDGGEILGQ